MHFKAPNPNVTSYFQIPRRILLQFRQLTFSIIKRIIKPLRRIQQLFERIESFGAFPAEIASFRLHSATCWQSIVLRPTSHHQVMVQIFLFESLLTLLFKSAHLKHDYFLIIISYHLSSIC